jgi:hypothetical protein
VRRRGHCLMLAAACRCSMSNTLASMRSGLVAG